MMNLELLLSMSKAYADDSLQNIACTHANTTIQHHFRDDYSTYHLVDYDPETGAVRGKQTVQGFSDDSSWSRGQAWALYSYTMMFRLTGYQNYLLQAGHIADMLLRRLPADGIPYWDFDAPVEEQTYRDASAAAIMASAFIELSRYIPGRQGILSCHGRKATPYACLERVSGRTGYERMFHPEAQRGCTS